MNLTDTHSRNKRYGRAGSSPKMLNRGTLLMCGPQRAAGAGGAVKSALREILQCDAKRALDCALPAPGDGHTHAEHGHAVFNGIDPAW